MRDLERESAYLPTIVIHELYKDQFETLGKDTAETRLNIIMRSGFEIVNLDVAIAKEAASLRCRHSTLPTADAIIAATAITTRSFRVISDDPHFKAVKQLKTEWV
jgi:predicted nucleic acid-binding protein